MVNVLKECVPSQKGKQTNTVVVSVVVVVVELCFVCVF